MAGEGNPVDPAQARMQMSIHVKVVGLLLVQRGDVPTRILSRTASAGHNPLECGGNADGLNACRAAETAFVYARLWVWTTVDTTNNAYYAPDGMGSGLAGLDKHWPPRNRPLSIAQEKAVRVTELCSFNWKGSVGEALLSPRLSSCSVVETSR